MPPDVGKAGTEGVQIFLVQLGYRDAAVVFKRPSCDDEDGGGRGEARFPAFDIEKFLRAQIGSKPGFRHDEISQLQSQAGADDAAAAVGDVGKRTAVHDHRCAFRRLDEIGLERILQKHAHGVYRLDVRWRNRLVIEIVADNDLAEPFAQIVHIFAQAEDGHDLRGGRNHKAVFSCLPVSVPESDHDAAQGTVVHIHGPFPDDLFRIQS